MYGRVYLVGFHCRGELMNRFFARLEMLFNEGCGIWIALIGVEFMILSFIYLTRGEPL